MDYSVVLKAVFSRPAPVIPERIRLPVGWTLSWHQAETLKALRDPTLDVVINTAMTGDGKSLAAYLSVMLGEHSAVGLYPTNELARDQELQVRGYIEQFAPANTPRVVRLSGPELEIYAENEGLKKSAAIQTLAGQREALLTNPDIFHYLHRGAYLTRDDSPDRLYNRIDKEFDLFIFDEFHVNSVPQIVGIINTMLLIRHTNRRKKFLFLSATPDPQLLNRLDLAGFCYRHIDPLANDGYRFPDTPEETESVRAEGWRRVTGVVKLQFVALDPASRATETWLREHKNLVLEHFQQHPHSKGAIILNSIAAVKRLMPVFRELLEPHGLTVRENTGLTGTGDKLQSLSADLVLGTSTIDVGVDFKINFLIFESADAGNFIQRLGRLGRHDGYERDGRQLAFETFTAYALVPNFLVGRLFLEAEAPLKDGNTYDRPFFHAQIKENYRKINDFAGYYSRWGGLQSLQLYLSLNNPKIRAQYAGSREAFKEAAQKVFNVSLGKQYGRKKGWEEEWQSLSGKPGNPIFDDATSFRGTSELQCGLYDLTEPREADRFKTYALPGILGNLETSIWTEAAFLRSLEETSKRTGQPIAKGRFKRCLAFMKLHTYREERLRWSFTYSGDLRPRAERWQVEVLTGIEVWQPGNPYIVEINRRLKQQALVSYVLHRSLAEVRTRLQLPMHFQIYPISDQYSLYDPDPPYSIAFGQSALLLDTLAYRLKSQGGEIWIA